MDKAERRATLLDAARRVFAERGYHEAKVGDIAKAADVAKGTVYLYFPDKRSIFVELIDTLFARVAEAISRVETDGDVEAQIKANIRAVFGVLVDEPDTMRMLFAHASAVDPAFRAKIEDFYGGLHNLLAASLAEGQELGIVAQGDVQLFARFTLGGLKEILYEAAMNPDQSRETMVEASFQLLQSGYLRIGGQ